MLLILIRVSGQLYASKEARSFLMQTSLIFSGSFRAGVESISNKLKTNLEDGLIGDDFLTRKEFFGDNFRPPLKAKTFCKIFFEALDDFMLKVLLVAATGSLIFEYIGADPDHYSTGK